MRLRHLWHEIYYKLVPPSGVDFAMTCREVVERIDLGQPPATRLEWFRIRLHLSLCQACHFYSRTSQALGRALRQMVDESGHSVDVEKLNQELVRKYSRTEAPKRPS